MARSGETDLATTGEGQCTHRSTMEEQQQPVYSCALAADGRSITGTSAACRSIVGISAAVFLPYMSGANLKTESVSRGCLHLIDLAGSESVDGSEVTGDKLKEAQHINKSLSALGDVIFALAQKRLNHVWSGTSIPLCCKKRCLRFCPLCPFDIAIWEQRATIARSATLGGENGDLRCVSDYCAPSISPLELMLPK